MPATIRDPTPDRLKPGAASVFDSPLDKALRLIGQVIGADNPTSQVLGMMGAMETGPAGGLMGAVGKLLERGQKTFRSASDLYSRLDGAVARLPDRPMPAGQVVSVAKKAGVTDDELRYRLGEFIASRGTKPVTKAEIEAALAARPITPQVKTLGGGGQSFRVVSSLNLADEAVQGFPRGQVPHFAVINENGQAISFHATPELAREAIEELPSLGIHGTGPAPKFSRYQVPGGQDYRETLLTLPTEGQMTVVPHPTGMGFALKKSDGSLLLNGPDTAAPNAVRQWDTKALAERYGIPAHDSASFHSSHFDDPNILVHTRSNVRDLPETGRGTFLEEVQSDWHQKGKKAGYGESQRFAIMRGQERLGIYDTQEAAQAWLDRAKAAAPGRHATAGITVEPVMDVRPGAVPDAPYKEAWPDLALKHHLVEAANDPNTNWLGFTGGQTQAARYDLSKQIDSLAASRRNDGQYAIQAYLPSPGPGVGAPVFSGANRMVVSEEQLEEYVGKEMARKIVAEAPGPGQGEKFWKGLDLQVGGDGMIEFYDKLLPKRLEKLVKPFGGTVERGRVPSVPSPSMPDNPEYMRGFSETLNAAATEPMWLTKLTPEMKARIAREGFPALMALIAAGELVPRQPDSR